jgi:hypothetical protein
MESGHRRIKQASSGGASGADEQRTKVLTVEVQQRSRLGLFGSPGLAVRPHVGQWRGVVVWGKPQGVGEPPNGQNAFSDLSDSRLAEILAGKVLDKRLYRAPVQIQERWFSAEASAEPLDGGSEDLGIGPASVPQLAGAEDDIKEP